MSAHADSSSPELPDGARGFGPLQSVRGDEIQLLLGGEGGNPSPDLIHATEGAMDELAGGYFLREKRNGEWVVLGVATTMAEARSWATQA